MGVAIDVGSFTWNNSDDTGTLLVKTLDDYTVTVMLVDDEAMADEENPYEIIDTIENEAIVAVSRSYLRYLFDDIDDSRRTMLTIGAFMGHVATLAMTNLQNKEA